MRLCTSARFITKLLDLATMVVKTLNASSAGNFYALFESAVYRHLSENILKSKMKVNYYLLSHIAH